MEKEQGFDIKMRSSGRKGKWANRGLLVPHSHASSWSGLSKVIDFPSLIIDNKNWDWFSAVINIWFAVQFTDFSQKSCERCHPSTHFRTQTAGATYFLAIIWPRWKTVIEIEITRMKLYKCIEITNCID